ncbi:hypothetical protein O181_002368 [Austropuccinia psidii MF-1]|uniref:Uncharacterized protein n=1 Tax=Austropuccinia psidii MF-1 TaxID=1389203 RepID=A0A9Q3GCK2_9BASI|nr:hypothetical protein [Austropuccinia psidii MF-1]
MISSFELLSQTQASHFHHQKSLSTTVFTSLLFLTSWSPSFLQHPIHSPLSQTNHSKNNLSLVQLPLKARQTSASCSEPKPQSVFHQISSNSNRTFFLKSALTTHESTYKTPESGDADGFFKALPRPSTMQKFQPHAPSSPPALTRQRTYAEPHTDSPSSMIERMICYLNNALSPQNPSHTLNENQIKFLSHQLLILNRIIKPTDQHQMMQTLTRKS